MTTSNVAQRLPDLLDIAALQTLLGLGRTATYARTRETGFPAPLGLSSGCYRWWTHEVLAWLESKRIAGHHHPTRAATAARLHPDAKTVPLPEPTPVTKRIRVSA